MYVVEFYKSPRGKSIIKEVFLSYTKQQKAKIIKAILNLEEYGINNVIPNLRKLSGTPLWEYRILGKDNIRIICVAVIKNKIFILNIFIKKSIKTPQKELKVCLERYKLVLDK